MNLYRVDNAKLDPDQITFALAQLRKFWFDNFEIMTPTDDAEAVLAQATRKVRHISLPCGSRKGIESVEDQELAMHLLEPFTLYERFRDEALKDALVKGPFARAYRGLGLHAKRREDGLWIDPTARFMMHLVHALSRPTSSSGALPRSDVDTDECSRIKLCHVLTLPHLVPAEAVSWERAVKTIPTNDDDRREWLSVNEQAWSAPASLLSSMPSGGLQVSAMTFNFRWISAFAEAFPEGSVEAVCPSCGHIITVVDAMKNHDFSTVETATVKMAGAKCDRCGVMFSPACPRVELLFPGVHPRSRE